MCEILKENWRFSFAFLANFRAKERLLAVYSNESLFLYFLVFFGFHSFSVSGEVSGNLVIVTHLTKDILKFPSSSNRFLVFGAFLQLMEGGVNG